MNRSAAICLVCLSAFAAGSAQAELPEGVHYDPGFAYFEAKQDDGHYYLSASARVFGGSHSRDSAFKFVVKQGRAALGQWTCRGRLTSRTRTNSSNRPNMLTAVDCKDRDLELTQSGSLTVEVYYIDDNTDEEHLVGEHTLDVRQLEVVGNRTDNANFVVNHHGQSAFGLLVQTQARGNHYFGERASSTNDVSVVFQRSPGENIRGVSVRCRVDGERIEFTTSSVSHTVVRERSTVASEVRQQGNGTETESVAFERRRYQLPVTFGDEDATGGATNLSAHPGRWECALRDNERRTVREFSFVVTGGVIQPHPEQLNGGLQLPGGVVLVDTTISDDSVFDARTDPQIALSGSFYGRSWVTDAARSAAVVPALGQPFPPSGMRAQRRGSRARR